MAAFTPWTATEVVQALVSGTQAVTPTLTDFTRGSVVRSLDEAWAITAQDYAQQVTLAVADATERALERALAIQPAPAQAAYGSVTLSVPTAPTSAAVLPDGFAVGVPQSTLQFQTGTAISWPSGATSLEAVVTCTVAGTLGNVPAATITQVISAVPAALNGLSVVNPAAFTTGANAQTVTDAAAEVPQRLAALKAATQDAVAAAALQATVTNSAGAVIEAAAAAVSERGGYVPAPTGAPVVAAVSGATALAAGTYGVAYAWATASGVTTASPTGAVTLTSGQAIQVTLPAFPGPGALDPSAAASSALVYATAAGGSALASAATTTGTTATITAAATGAAPASGNTAWAGTPGFATVWLANDLGTAPSSGLLASASAAISGSVSASGPAQPGTLAAGIMGAVVPAALVSQPVTAAVLPLPGYTLAMVSDAVALAVTEQFSGLDIGQPLAYNPLVLAMTAVPGVGDVVLAGPTGTVAGARGVRLVPGTITLTQEV